MRSVRDIKKINCFFFIWEKLLWLVACRMFYSKYLLADESSINADSESGRR